MGLISFSAGTNAVSADVNTNFNECRNLTVLSWAGFEQAKISCTDAVASNTFAIKKKYVYLHNDGSNTVYIDFETDATTNSFPLSANERIDFPAVISKISVICDSTKTSTLRIIGLGDTTDTVSLKTYKVSTTATNTSQAVTAGTKQLIIRNWGFNKTYVNLDGAATTNHYYLDAKSTLILGKQTTTSVQLINDTAKTSDIRIIEVAEW